MRYLLFLGLLTGCTMNFENGKCYAYSTSKYYEYGHIYIEGLFLQYDKFGGDKNIPYSSVIGDLWENLNYSQIDCPTKFEYPYDHSIREYKDMEIWDKMKEVLYKEK